MEDNHEDLTKKPSSKLHVSFISGGLGGIVAKTVIAPLDRAKTIYQVKGD